MSTSPREGSANAGSSNGLEEKPRLSEHEKKANHIASGKCSASSNRIVPGLTVAKFQSRTETQTSYPRRLRQTDRIGTWIGRSREK
jgi:hypothetical protein